MVIKWKIKRKWVCSIRFYAQQWAVKVKESNKTKEMDNGSVRINGMNGLQHFTAGCEVECLPIFCNLLGR